MSNLRSMTGFGSAESSNNNISVKVEIRSLNSKFFDCSVRTSKIFRNKETEIRQMTLEKIGRGSIQINISAEYVNPDLIASQLNINHKIAKNYKEQIDELTQDLGIQNPDIFNYIVQLPEVIRIEEPQTDESDWEITKQTIDKAFEQFDEFRIQEGKALAKDLINNSEEILNHLNSIKEVLSERKEHIKSKLKSAVEEINEKVQADPTRFEYELLYYLEKLDINEEIVRLNNHIKFFIETIEGNADGKKLGFISQEMGREINTMGSKANYFKMQKHVVEMKNFLEKIKEQVLNVL